MQARNGGSIAPLKLSFLLENLSKLAICFQQRLNNMLAKIAVAIVHGICMGNEFDELESSKYAGGMA